jgi:hypothetical protein
MVDSELESFKTNVDLRAYAAVQGYELDRKESWRGSSVMRHPAAAMQITVPDSCRSSQSEYRSDLV